MSLMNRTERCGNNMDEGCHGFQWVCQIIAAEGIFGVLGNALVCFVILRVRFLHNKTNYLLVNLAVADGLICLQTFFYHLAAAPYCKLIIYVPESAAARELFCRLLATNYLGWALSYNTAYNLCMVTFERYAAIVHPLHYARKLSDARIKKLIPLIWVLSIVLALPFLATNAPSSGPDEACTGIQYPHRSFPFLVGLMSCLLAYVLPVASMSWAYFKIQMTLKKQAKELRLQHAREAAYDLVRARQRLISMLTLVLGALAVLWTPLYVQSLFCLHATQDADISLPVCSSRSYLYSLGIFRAMFYLNSVINPIIYEFKYKKFRQGFKVAFCCCLNKHANNRVNIEMV